MLLEYVKNVQPDYMERFVQKAPSQVGSWSICWVLLSPYAKVYVRRFP